MPQLYLVQSKACYVYMSVCLFVYVYIYNDIAVCIWMKDISRSCHKENKEIIVIHFIKKIINCIGKMLYTTGFTKAWRIWM